MQTGRKIAAAHDDHKEAMQMMSGFGNRFLDGTNIGGGRPRNRLRMCMPVADKVQSLLMHRVNLSLFLAAVGKV
jgi:hypothetical protein